MFGFRYHLRQLHAAVQVGHSGAFPPHRLTAFEVYEQSTSWWRALVVCAFTPVPALLCVLSIDAIFPLAPLDKPLGQQYSFLVRSGLSAAIIGCGMLNLAHQFVSTFPISRWALVASAMATGVLYAIVILGYQILWHRFPVPFLLVQTTPLFFIVWAGAAYIIFVRQRVQTASPNDLEQWRQRFKSFLVFVVWIVSLLFMYSIYGVVFVAVSGSLQLVVVAFPSLFKQLIKTKVASICRAVDANDAIPEIVSLTVELFHALFVSICLQNASSPLRTTLVILVLDVLPSLTVAYRMRQYTRVMPSPRTLGPTFKAPTETNLDPLLRRRKLLFLCEYHILIEYIECTIPLVSTVALVVQYHLPNGAYYPMLQRLHALANASSDSEVSPLITSMTNVLVFIGLEVVSLLMFSVAVRYYVGISCLKLLAFSLETQAEAIQAKLFIWIPYCMLIPIAHGGVDFSLRFDWVHQYPEQ